MSENQPGEPSIKMETAERCSSPQSSVGIRKSARLLKPSLLHAHQDSTASTSSNPLPSPTADDAAEPNASASGTKDGKQRKGKVWEPAEENLFFDALKMYGKDYDAIVKYITQKSKSKSSKNIEQVRNYYHNSSTKMLALLDLADIDVSKEVKELFLLINFGEWKRKTNNLKINAKWLKFFRNLVTNGWTVVKLRGPTKTTGKKKRSSCTIRTPMCYALRRLFEGKDDIPVDTNVPKNITIELSPNSQRDRAYVLGCWQNPFIRFELSLNQPVSEWLRWLQNKWIPQDLRSRKALLGEDISNEQAAVVLYPSPDTVLRTVKLNPAGTKSNSMSAQSSNSAHAAYSVPYIGLGLRYYYDSKCGASSSARPEQWPPLSPGKNDRKRRKSTPVVNEIEQQTSDVDGVSSKRFRPNLASPTPDDGAELKADMARQFSDGGEGESSCDACPAAGTVVETEGDATGTGNERKATVQGSSVQSTEENGAIEKSDVITVKDSSSRQQAHSITLNPDLLRNGLDAATCGSLTVGQLCLMCDKARIIRLKYTITPKCAQHLVSAVDSWSFFVNLVRSNFLDSISKKTVQATSFGRVQVVSPSSTNSMGVAPEASSQIVLNNVVGTTFLEGNDAVISQTIEEERWRQRRPQDEVFATPHAVSQTKKKAPYKETSRVDSSPTVPINAHYCVNEDPNAFLQQMGHMIKKPLGVTRRRAVVVCTAPSNKVPISSLSAASSSKSYQRKNLNQVPMRVPTATGSPATSVNYDQRATIGQQSIGSGSGHAVVTENQPSVESHSSFSTNCHVQSASAIGESSTLNTPDVSLMRTSPPPPVECFSEAPIGQLQETVSEPANKATIAETMQVSVAQTAPLPQQDVITSDSFLDFSLGSFPGFGMKSMGSPKRVEKEPVLNVIHSLRLEPDDSALSSPPRPIRTGTVHKNDATASYQPGAALDSNLFPSTSNLFPLLDASMDNESSNTRNFFAACAMASALNTPEKCKDDERR